MCQQMITSNLMNKNVYIQMWRFVYLQMYSLSFINKFLLGYCKISPWKMCFLTLSVSKTGKFWMLSGHQYHNWKKSENLIALNSFFFLWHWEWAIMYSSLSPCIISLEWHSMHILILDLQCKELFLPEWDTLPVGL